MKAEPANVLEVQKTFFLLLIFQTCRMQKELRFDKNIFLTKTEKREILMDLWLALSLHLLGYYLVPDLYHKTRLVL